MILIVEDEAFIREMVEIMIQDLGYSTITATDVDEGLAILHSTRSIRMLFTDINLKAEAFGGCDLARQAVELRPKLRVLYATGNLVTDEMEKWFVEGAHVLRKPYTQRQLQVSINDMLAA